MLERVAALKAELVRGVSAAHTLEGEMVFYLVGCVNYWAEQEAIPLTDKFGRAYRMKGLQASRFLIEQMEDVLRLRRERQERTTSNDGDEGLSAEELP